MRSDHLNSLHQMGVKGQLAVLVTTASGRVRFTVSCTLLESIWCRPWAPESLSHHRFWWRKTPCPAHSRSAFGSLRPKA